VQHALYPYNDPGQLPIKPLREENGEWLRLPIHLPGLKLWIRAWYAQVGNATLYLLDSNDPANPPNYRGITSELYGGGPDLRIRQEQVLGIVGWRLLRKLGLHPDVCHLNEGHAAFAILERARTFMREHQQPFNVALAVTRAGNLFTTHTPVEAGFDFFSPELMERSFKQYAEEGLGIGVRDLLALGRRDPNDNSESFNMANLAMRGCGAVNGVSKLHGEVSRRIFQPLFPRWPRAEVPVGHVTNGIHGRTWESDGAQDLWKSGCGEDYWRWEMENLGPCFHKIPDNDLWKLRASSSRALIEYTRKRLAYQRAAQGAPPAEVAEAERVFDFDTLTLGFARRFATYKRPNLLLHDPDRLVRILSNPQRPVQLILAGKAHPKDLAGQEMIRQWHDFIRRADVRGRVVFLSDYDMLLTQQLVQGVDVWINTPRRPWEASGTSGMKAVVNGALNLSQLDGWWAEAFSPEVGWAIGDSEEHGEDPAWDGHDADALYDRLEREVIPQFYDRDPDGIPRNWIAKMRASMANLGPLFSANRAVREYTEAHYLPAAAAYHARAADGGKFGGELVNWENEVAGHWQHLRFGAVNLRQEGDHYVFDAHVYLNELAPDFVKVEIYADAKDGGAPFRQAMDRGQPLAGAAGAFLYSGRAHSGRPAADYTLRIVPFKEGAFVPLEAPQILWQQ
jgi:glycogen phosphorylase